MPILGIDEVGRGPLAGPLVVGAVILPEEEKPWFNDLKDSKKLSAKKRETLNKIILQEAVTSLGWVPAHELDELGISEALRLATKRAVKSIQSLHATFSQIIIDGKINFLSNTPLENYTSTLIKADDKIREVSAASIIANVANPNDVEGEMGDQTISSSATSVILYAPNFSRADYGFVAWNTKADGTGTNYGPNQTLEFNAGAYSAGGIKLYAKWIVSAGNMQNWSGCSNMSQGDVTALKDTRDNDVYAVAKLADGKCWMIENLRLADKDSSNNDIILSSSNTHNPSLPLTNSWWYSSANDNDTKPTSNHLSASVDPTQTAWCSVYTSATNCIDQSMLNTDNTTLFTNNVASNYNAGGNVYSYGNYYNWYSATAGHGRYSSSSGFNASGDICPKGWHLPTGKDATSEFGVLDINLGGTGQGASGNAGKVLSKTYRSYPNNFILPGTLSGSSISNRNSSGSYCSASSNAQYYNYSWYIAASQATPSVHYKYPGKSVRCIAGT